jgi:hypothetical protein
MMDLEEIEMVLEETCNFFFLRLGVMRKNIVEEKLGDLFHQRGREGRGVVWSGTLERVDGQKINNASSFWEDVGD